MSKEQKVDKTTKKIDDLFDTMIKIQLNYQSKMQQVQVVLQGLKKLRQGTAQNILGEKLLEPEVIDLVAKIETKIKSLNLN